MHLTLAFALIMRHNQNEVRCLEEEHTRALMPLGREPHGRMAIVWPPCAGDSRWSIAMTCQTSVQAIQVLGTASQHQSLLARLSCCALGPFLRCCCSKGGSLFRNTTEASLEKEFEDEKSTLLCPCIQRLLVQSLVGVRCSRPGD